MGRTAQTHIIPIKHLKFAWKTLHLLMVNISFLLGRSHFFVVQSAFLPGVNHLFRGEQSLATSWSTIVAYRLQLRKLRRKAPVFRVADSAAFKGSAPKSRDHIIHYTYPLVICYIAMV
jgi:hypothetical protein